MVQATTAMDTETLFTGSKWDILTSLAARKRSPLELAQESRTSVANISQQLRLLEMAGLVTSERIPNRDRGQPRIIYRIPEPKAFVISTSTGVVRKGFVPLSPARQAMMNCWLGCTPESAELVEKFLFNNSGTLDKIKAIFLNKKDQFTLILVTDDSAAKKSLGSRQGKLNVETRTSEGKIASHDIIALYDPTGLLRPEANQESRRREI